MSVDSSSVLLCCLIIVFLYWKKILLCKKFVEPIVQCQSFLVQKEVTINKSILTKIISKSIFL